MEIFKILIGALLMEHPVIERHCVLQALSPNRNVSGEKKTKYYSYFPLNHQNHRQNSWLDQKIV